ncbi:glycosyltransferase family 4 protein [Hymenobacter sp. GOD-10R]|uniref:glycosyltransferase family 4 protein n=1 Tax=Hymenobacter sp. GOD-10R TaxID=3093922 RepID=UPI002D793A19|nr:glycosyltransferase family 4 protein [Hymenobacter sp. GOD-10R]WRQ30349.1 glycosyltransferase family 4 protein [Hymenobacter sp. GOD-10R]
MKKVLFVGENAYQSKSGIVTVMKQFLEDEELNKCVNYKVVFTIVDETSSLQRLKAWIKACIRFFYLLPQVDLVHIHHASDLNFWLSGLLIYIAKITGKKTIMHNHAADFHLFYANCSKVKKNLIRRILKRTDVNLVLSTAWYNWYSALVPNANWTLLRNSIDIPKDVEKKVLANGKAKLLFLARLEERKGIFDLVDIMPDFFAQYPDCELYIAGQGDTTQIQKVIQQYRLETQVKILGYINDKQRDLLLRDSHLLILPTYNEGLPMSLLEAMAYSVVPITTPVGGIPDVVVDKVNGYLVQPGNKKELLETICYVVENAHLYRKVSDNAHNLVADKFDFARYKESVINMYELA